MSKSDATETSLLSYVFTATNPSWHSATELQVHLHTSNPGDTGITTTGLPSYGGYAAVTVNRTTGDWTVTGDTATNDNLIQFPQAASGSDTITHVSISPQGSTTILYYGALTSPLSVSTGIQPQFAAGSLDVTES
jgi:hypothetical protein